MNTVVYRGFYTEHNGVQFPIALLQFDGLHAYCWSWINNGAGHISYFDFAVGKAATLMHLTETHASLHASGVRQLTISTAKKRRSITKQSGPAIADLQSWRHFDSVPVPLGEALPWIMKPKRWNKCSDFVRLTKKDFFQKTGGYLQVFLCRRASFSALAKRKYKRHWSLDCGEMILAVFTER